MKCPICKKTIPDNALKCPYCKARTGLLCKNCNTVNSIFDFTCKKCGKEILKRCPNCGSVNFPNAFKCRKCGYSFKKIEPEKEINLEYPANLVSQQSAKNILVKGILSPKKKIFSLNGNKGIGKSLVLKAVMQELKAYSWLYGKCTPITQLTSGGVVQDILLNAFNLPNFCVNNAQFKRDSAKFFKNEFPELKSQEIFDVINFLYPSKEGTFEEIVTRKNYMFATLEKIFNKLTAFGKFVLVIDNFDFIDGFSYEFISRYIKKKAVWENLKFLILYNEPKPAKGYFYFPTINDNIYLDIGIAPLKLGQVGILLEQKEKKIEGFPKLNKFEIQEIFDISHGNPSYINHALDLCFDCQLAGHDFELATNFAGLLEFRLNLLSQINSLAYDILLGAAVIGDKINMALVKEIFEVDDKTFIDVMVYLKKMDYITPINDMYCEFSSLLLWETILKTAKGDPNYREINQKIFKHLSALTLNSHAILGIIAQNLKQPELALDIWTKTTRFASYIGDLNLYAISQKQSLALINEFDETQTLKIRYNISERLGKLLANSNPTEAIEYLPDAISNAQAVGDSPREIELLAYLANCCRNTGNYFGEVECVDTVLKKIGIDNKLEIALLKTTKLNALLSIGNCGQIINMVDNEIMPELDKFLNKKSATKSFELGFIYEVWLKTYLVLANALVMQGNDRSFEILTILFDIIERNNIQDNLFICKCKLTLAFANTMKGNFPASEQMLEEVLKLYRENVMDNETILRWNFINIVNNFFRKNYDGIQEDLFQVVTFANNNGDNFTKNILKTLLGKVFKDNDNAKQALEIYNDQIAYFAKEKMAVGALLTWFLIADATLITEGAQKALETAEQALEVAQNPKINNYFFMILFKMIIAKCSITMSDFGTAKINLESAIELAERYNLKDLLGRLYTSYGKYFQELGLVKSPEQMEYLEGAQKMYEKAKKIVNKAENKYVYSDLAKAMKSLHTFCCVNNLKVFEP